MKIKLENPVLIDSKEDVSFMIVEHIEVNQHMADVQISYYGKVFDYDVFAPKNEREGQWVYDLSLNVCLSKNEHGQYE